IAPSMVVPPLSTVSVTADEPAPPAQDAFKPGDDSAGEQAQRQVEQRHDHVTVECAEGCGDDVDARLQQFLDRDEAHQGRVLDELDEISAHGGYRDQHRLWQDYSPVEFPL